MPVRRPSVLRFVTIAVWILPLIAACSGASLTQPTAPAVVSAVQPTNLTAGDPAAASAAAVDISGTWQWRETSVVAARPFTAMLFGILPEGPITRFTCESGGELTITPVTAVIFVGSATQSSECRTQGGVVFDPSPIFPPALQLEEGEIRGHSFRFVFTTGGPPCPHTGAIRVQDGTAVELIGSGDCELPKANELGQYKDIQFIATR